MTKAEALTLTPGRRVYVADEASAGTVVSVDPDCGVDVELDSDGVIVSCAYAQVETLSPLS
jgi:hypothetical protein